MTHDESAIPGPTSARGGRESLASSRCPAASLTAPDVQAQTPDKPLRSELASREAGCRDCLRGFGVGCFQNEGSISRTCALPPQLPGLRIRVSRSVVKLMAAEGRMGAVPLRRGRSLGGGGGTTHVSWPLLRQTSTKASCGMIFALLGFRFEVWPRLRFKVNLARVLPDMPVSCSEPLRSNNPRVQTTRGLSSVWGNFTP